MIGKTISHYTIIEKLGEGGMGLVYKAEDTKLKRLVALKFLPPHHLAGEEERTRFLHEAQAAAALNHPNICTIYEINEGEEGQPFLVMEYVAGSSLKDILQQRSLSIAEILHFALQIAEGLQAAHGKGIVHRDIKPANILVDEKGQIKITDFGLAKLAHGTRITQPRTTLGTVSYMSPEQARGESVDFRTDIWSFGVVLYEMVTGQLPFKGEYEQAIVYAILNESPTPPGVLRKGVPSKLEKIILKAMAKNPEERYQRIEEMIADLTALRDSLKQLSPPQSRRRRRFNGLKMGIGFGGVLLLLLVLFWAVRGLLFKPVVGSSRIPIAVISFENQTGDPQYDYLQTAIPNLLISKLEQSHYLRVMTWERMHDLLVQMGQTEVDVIDKHLGFELCKRDSVNFIVVGSYTKAGDVFATDVKILDVRNKRLLKSASARGEGAGSILKNQIDQLSEEIVNGIGFSAQRELKEMKLPVSDITTASLEAYRYYLNARKEFLNGNGRKAEAYCYQALRIDSTFARAYIMLYLSTVKPEVEKWALQNAYQYRYKAGKKWQYWIKGFYALGFERNRQKSVALFRKMAEEFPGEKYAHLALGWILYILNEIDRAIPSLKRAVALDPTLSAGLNILGYAYLKKRNFETAHQYFQRYIDAYPEYPNPYDSMGDFYVTTGQFNIALAYFQKALQKNPNFASSRKIAYLLALREDYDSTMAVLDQYFIKNNLQYKQANGHFYRGFYLFWVGQTRRALKELEQAVQIAKAQKLTSVVNNAQWLKVWILFEQGAVHQIKAEARKWITAVNSPRDVDLFFLNKVKYQFMVGIIDLRLQQPDSARIRLAVMQNLISEIPTRKYREEATYYYTRLSQEIEFSLGDLRKAAALIKSAEALRHSVFDPDITMQVILYGNVPILHDISARIYEKEGKLQNAIQEYERFMGMNGKRKHYFLTPPIFHFRLGRLYETVGEMQKMVNAYQTFLHLTQQATVWDAERKHALLVSGYYPGND